MSIETMERACREKEMLSKIAKNQKSGSKRQLVVENHHNENVED